MEDDEPLPDVSSVSPPNDRRSDSHRSPLVVDTAESLARLFSVLADAEPRHIIYVLFHHDETTIALPRLVRSVATISDVDDRTRLRERMVRMHLPRLGFVGIVDYDLTGDPHVWLSTNTDIVDKELLYDVVKRSYRYERRGVEAES
ncbi:hypothetical protein ZOD2009_17458 [Haladaptatus paucihalophilus DX253]|uniref:Uncharacterized protein n=1 Tax=Haladaptatus paucihalophilus DX253 TaxID=797209 RepID=E7QXF3_HALPU|nr:hypothetical protein [Haladaptatus paucihalophilus]EFW90956.1 hypothetical protein ZOD2009_17458 [Haladaptatus paucihalophilus DX253]SHK27370.1 hypothetical protein SAMN05444342_1170 [Haladaptatus paucihalophilus DX253]